MGGFETENIKQVKFNVAFQWTEIKAYSFLGAFAELRKAIISFVMSVRPAIPYLSRSIFSAWNNSARTGRIFTKFDI